MTDDLQVSNSIASFIRFIKRNKNTLLLFLLISVVSTIFFQKLKKPYYTTEAICSSGISEYERMEQVQEMSQRTAVDLINLIDINAQNKDYNQLSELLNVDLDVAKAIREIEAEQLYQQDMDEKYYALNKFSIKLTTYNKDLLKEIQIGLENYINENEFIKKYHQTYLKCNEDLIKDIELEISDLKANRSQGIKQNYNLSSYSILSGKNRSLSNEIISLSHMREELSPTIIEERQMNIATMDVFSRLMMDRIIFLGVPINDYVANIIQAQLLFLESVDAKKDILIYLNTPGGSVYAGLGIYDTMQYINCDVSTICTGMAASMGAVLLCAGEKGKRTALKHSRVMIHQPLGGAHGQASDIEITANEIKKLKTELYEIISNHTGQKFDKVWADGDRDFWMKSDEAKDYGMIDEVLQKNK